MLRLKAQQFLTASVSCLVCASPCQHDVRLVIGRDMEKPNQTIAIFTRSENTSIRAPSQRPHSGPFVATGPKFAPKYWMMSFSPLEVRLGTLEAFPPWLCSSVLVSREYCCLVPTRDLYRTRTHHTEHTSQRQSSVGFRPKRALCSWDGS